ncbi:MAG: YceI family protein, partial [Pseudomonadota bacterium]
PPLFLRAAAAVAWSAPENYTLNAAQSVVAFTYNFQGNPSEGRMPVKDARMELDLRNVPASHVEVTLDASEAKAGFLFATQAMKGPNVLNTDQFPEIHFRSTKITGDLRGAEIQGDLTIRDVTRPVTLRAGLYRQEGTEKGDRSRLIVQLNGKVSRAAFGAGGFPGFVDDMINLNIIARIEK